MEKLTNTEQIVFNAMSPELGKALQSSTENIKVNYIWDYKLALPSLSIPSIQLSIHSFTIHPPTHPSLPPSIHLN